MTRDATAGAPDPQFSSEGLFRDGKLLVAQLNCAKFPNRCVVSFEAIEKPNFKYLKRLSGERLRQVSGFAKTARYAVGNEAAGAVAIAAVLLTARSISLQIGLNEELRAKYVWRRRLAYLLRDGGVLAFLPLPIILFLLAGWAKVISFGTVANIAPYCMLIGLLSWITGFALSRLGSNPPLEIIGADGEYVWLEGAHPRLLDGVPAFAPVRSGDFRSL